MVTAYGDLDGAVRAMREGAFDFFSKPVKLHELVASLQRTERFQALRRENARYREHLDRLGAEDILPLAHHLLEQFAREMRNPVEGFTPEAEALLKAHPFPGNVRELRNTVERAVILCKAGRVTPTDLNLPPSLSAGLPAASGAGPDPVRTPHPDDNLNLAEAEVRLIREALRRSGGNRAQTARLLGLSRSALHRRMAHYNLRWSDGRI